MKIPGNLFAPCVSEIPENSKTSCLFEKNKDYPPYGPAGKNGFRLWVQVPDGQTSFETDIIFILDMTNRKA